MRLRLAFALAVVLVDPSVARAHVTVAPPFVPAAASSVVRFDVPNEREGRPMTFFAVTVPAGMRAQSGERSGPWTAAVDGRTVTWRGGSLAPLATATFALRAVAPPRAGTVRIAARQGYADGRSVRWNVDLTVTPAERGGSDENLTTAALVGVIGLAVIGASLVVLRRTRRRSLQDR